MLDQTGWPSGAARRARAPAGPKSADLKSVSQVKRRQVHRDDEIPQQQVPSQRRQQRPSHEQFYQRVLSTDWQQAQKAASRKPLFAQTHAAAASTAALRAKLCPALDTTQDWTRVQRKLLPKYMFVLDAVTAVHLLQCLARLQPLLATDHQQRSCACPADQPQPANSQQQQGPSLDQLAQLPTSIYGAIAGPHPGAWPAAAPTHAQRAAADAVAGARGFPSTAAARDEFDVMLAAVYTVLAVKVTAWPFGVLDKLLACAGQLQLRHQGFLQACLAASQPGLSQQPAAGLISCLEAVSRLQTQPPQAWWREWQQGTQGQLDQLSLTQLTALQLHLAHLQQHHSSHQQQQQQEEEEQYLQLPDSWWQEFEAVTLHQVTGSGSLQQPGPHITAAQPAGQGPSITVPQPGRLSVADVDALCTLLGTRHLLKAPQPQQEWLSAALQLCEEACQQGCVSAAGALQLLTACCFGCCLHLPAAAAAQAAALSVVQLRMPRLSAQAGVAVLFACLCQPRAPAQLPAGFVEALGSRLTQLLPQLPTELLLEVPHVLAAATAAHGGPKNLDERLLAALSLTSQARLVELDWADLHMLLRGCVAAGLGDAMPQLWCAAVLRRAQELPPGGGVRDAASGHPLSAVGLLRLLQEADERGSTQQ